MARRPLALYRTLLTLVDGDDEAARVRALRRALRQPRSAWPDGLADAVTSAGVSVGYLERGLLSIHTFAPEVREALEHGLPFAVARLVNGVRDEAERRDVLAPLWDPPRSPDGSLPPAGGALLPRGVAQRIERAARAARERLGQAALRDGGDGAPRRVDERGWLPADVPAATPVRLPGQVWTFPPVRRGAAALELLASRVIEALVARLLPRGGNLVDVTAGSGTVASVARRFGVRSWSGDLAPAAPFVHRADARDLVSALPPGLERGCADLLVVHPPTYPLWRRQRLADGALADVEGYRDDVAAMITGSLGLVRPGGHVVVIARPVRTTGRVWISTSHVAESLEDAGLRVSGYVVAVADGGSDDWHLLIAHVPIRASVAA